MSRTMFSTIFAIGFAVFLVLASVPSAQAQCSNSILKNSYGVQLKNGDEDSIVGTFAISFNGTGGITSGKGWVAKGGSAPVFTAAISGSYTVDPSCRVSGSLNLPGTPFGTVTYDGFVNGDGEEVRLVFTSGEQMDAVAKKVGPVNCSFFPNIINASYASHTDGTLGLTPNLVNLAGGYRLVPAATGEERGMLNGGPINRSLFTVSNTGIDFDCTTNLRVNYTSDPLSLGLGGDPNHFEEFFVVAVDGGNRIMGTQKTNNVTGLGVDSSPTLINIDLFK